MKKILFSAFICIIFSLQYFQNKMDSIFDDTFLYSSAMNKTKDVEEIKANINSRVFEGDLTFPIYNPNFMKLYFMNNKENFGYNFYGSCGYVAADLLLSYYDTFWNDNLIYDNYDVSGCLESYDRSLPFSSSPGTRNEENELQECIRQKIYIKGCFTFGDLFEFIDANKNTYYHLNLLSESDFYWNHYDDDYFRRIIISDENGTYYYQNYSFQLSSTEFINLVNNKVLLYGGKLVTNSNEGVSARDFVISRVKMGIPVALGVSNSKEAHIVIAYDYDESANLIFVHSGYENNTYTTIEDLGYINYNFAAALEFSTSHKCSNNIKHGSNSYCICELDGTHENHSHKYSYEIFKGTTKYHLAYCICRTLKQDLHIKKEAVLQHPLF